MPLVLTQQTHGLMMGQRRRRWASIKSTLGQCLIVFAWKVASQKTQNICKTFVQRRPNVFDVGPTLYKCYTNVFTGILG